MDIIKIRNLKKYYGKNIGVEDINLNVEKGKIFGFIGPNGAGKSTTIRVLMNLLKDYKGEAFVDFHDSEKNKNKNQYIGYVPSEINLYKNIKVKEILEFNSKVKDYDKEENKKLSDYFSLDTNKKVVELSHGNKKKLSIICAIANDPDLIILDEPTNGLDPIIQKKFYDLLLKKAKEGKTIFFSSHNLNEIRNLCDEVAIIKEGRIIESGEIDSLDKAKLKKVKITLPEKSNLDFKGKSYKQVKKQKNIVSFNYFGDINNLIETLQKEKIKDLSIEEPSLEEVFFHYYEGEKNNG